MSSRTKTIARRREAEPVSSAANALTGWEDADAHHARLDALMREHAPQGPTETHLVERLAQLMLRCDRLVATERGLLAAGLHRATDSPYDREAIAERVTLMPGGEGARRYDVAEAIRTTARDDARVHRAMVDARRALAAARTRLRRGGPTAYAEALAQLLTDQRDEWAQALVEEADDDGAPHWRPTPADLLRYIDTELEAAVKAGLAHVTTAPLLRAQAHAQAFEPEKMAALYDLDAHLVRQFEKTLAMLLKLQAMRAAPGTEGE